MNDGEFLDVEENFEKLKQKYEGQNAVVGFSGGIDSSGVIILLKKLGIKKLQPVFLNRGQKAAKWEEKTAKRILDEFFIPKYDVEAILTVFYFSIGTFIGLFPLALAKESFETQVTNQKRKRIYIIMIMIIIIFNTIIMILSFLRIHIFPVHVQ